jgi:hypothetical protein
VGRGKEVGGEVVDDGFEVADGAFAGMMDSRVVTSNYKKKICRKG